MPGNTGIDTEDVCSWIYKNKKGPLRNEKGHLILIRQKSLRTFRFGSTDGVNFHILSNGAYEIYKINGIKRTKLEWLSADIRLESMGVKESGSNHT